MGLIDEIRLRARHIVGPVLCLVLVGYFAYHLVNGERGFIALLQLDQQIQEAKANAAILAKERTEVESRVALMRPDQLDPDMLEERARLMLSVGHPDEVVILPLD
ncbi:MAG TPA: septum formation initiator [Rhodospirillaceae bacterium]|jgi:cell division protein FtsB|nr:septum formation initiator family protein [Alphaproteobacteria bacterium]MDP6659970.1 septum formation initiator family protein [Alphaproteobacteria bacterium]MDP6780146.1 septum formation initiator family protein [Alphaproteobacteria bacterium]HAQ33474.1 septum formation initiator [Rhodospirillaceae bacterium]|tara:strand:- start:731 stop:1045 length:315 start_codon:yes stop_codon:yes gene_type:complete